jgi:hypothetical protein
MARSPYAAVFAARRVATRSGSTLPRHRSRRVLVGGYHVDRGGAHLDETIQLPLTRGPQGALPIWPSWKWSFLVYFSLLKTWSVTSLSFISVFTPAIALALGFVFLDERPTLWTAVGTVLILAGVGLALSKFWPRTS